MPNNNFGFFEKDREAIMQAFQFSGTDIKLAEENFAFSVNEKEILQKAQPLAIASAIIQLTNMGLRTSNIEGNVLYYNGKIQVQIGYRGLIQLALKSGEYSELGSTEVRDGDNKSTLMDKIKVKSNYTYTEENTSNYKKPIIGYYAYFELKNGFKKDIFMNIQELEEHAKKYSYSWNSTTKQFSHVAKERMFEVTVIKQLLTKYGPKDETLKEVDNSDLKIHDGNDAKWLDNNRRMKEDLLVNKASPDDIKAIINTVKMNEKVVDVKAFIKDSWMSVFNVDKTMDTLTVGELQTWKNEVELRLNKING